MKTGLDMMISFDEWIRKRKGGGGGEALPNDRTEKSVC
jgi:hypothetical protein